MVAVMEVLDARLAGVPVVVVSEAEPNSASSRVSQEEAVVLAAGDSGPKTLSTDAGAMVAGVPVVELMAVVGAMVASVPVVELMAVVGAMVASVLVVVLMVVIGAMVEKSQAYIVR